MSWHFLQEQEEAFWEGSSLDGAPSALLRLIPMPGKSFSRDNETEFLNLSPSGTTSEPSTDGLGAATSTLFRGDSPVKTYRSQERVQVSTESEAAYGGKWRELSVRFDLVLSSWKTHRTLFDEVLPESSVTLPRWGMMRGGVLLERTTLALHIGEIGSGSLGGRCPTPTVYGNHNRKGLSKNSGDGLSTWVKKFPTPRAFMHKDSHHDRGKKNLGEVIGGPLNPQWVEWLMGWPVGWTDLKPLATDKFQVWLRSHGIS